MTNLEFIKKNKISEIVKDILATALYADNTDHNYQNELIALHWLFSEKASYGDFTTYVNRNEKWLKETKDVMDDLPFTFTDDLPFTLDEEGNQIV